MACRVIGSAIVLADSSRLGEVRRRISQVTDKVEPCCLAQLSCPSELHDRTTKPLRVIGRADKRFTFIF